MTHTQGNRNKRNGNEFDCRKVPKIPKNRVNISKLKNFAISKLPFGSPLREVLVSEDRELDVNTFLARLPLYLKLNRLEENWRKHG